MQFALTETGARAQAVRGLSAMCPICRAPVIAKCGKIKVHHWAHAPREDCDAWFEPETEWHRAWKNLFPIDQVEVPFGEHRADIFANGQVVELQNSAISPAEIQDREKFYGRMIWIVNAERFAERFFLLKVMSEGIFSFKWKHMKSSWRFARQPVYFDFGSLAVRDLLGAHFADRTVIRNPNQEFQRVQSVSIERYRGQAKGDWEETGYRAEPLFEHLKPETLECAILQRQTLHENGFGSVRAIRLEDLLGLCGMVR